MALINRKDLWLLSEHRTTIRHIFFNLCRLTLSNLYNQLLFKGKNNHSVRLLRPCFKDLVIIYNTFIKVAKPLPGSQIYHRHLSCRVFVFAKLSIRSRVLSNVSDVNIFQGVITRSVKLEVNNSVKLTVIFFI